MNCSILVAVGDLRMCYVGVMWELLNMRLYSTLALCLAIVTYNMHVSLQVVTYRLKNEYGVDSTMETLDFTITRWAGGGWEAVDRADAAGKLHGVFMCQDAWGRPVLLFRNPWKVAQLENEVRELRLEPWALPPTERRR